MILEKAVLRFAHFGIQKTTMNEIADDLSMSKPSVYYYFPDKTSLIIGVIEKILAEYQENLALLFAGSQNVKDAIFHMLDLRRQFLQKYFMLHLTDNSEHCIQNDEIRSSVSRIREKEKFLLKEVFDKGIQLNEIRSADAGHTAELYLNMLTGITICVLAEQKQLVPDSKVFEEVLSKQKELSEIFLNGIK